MKAKELKGLKSLGALNTFHTLMLGLKMLPAYMTETYEDFFERLELMNDVDRRKMIVEAVLFVKLDPTELESLLCFVDDKNGVPFSRENIGSLSPEQLIEAIVLVSLEVAKIKINFLSPAEKKN